MISKEGKLISATFAELRQFGFIVANFNTQGKKRLGSGMRKLCDYIIAGHSGLHFIEVKLESTGDRIRPDQVMFKKIITAISSWTVWVHYWSVVSLDQAGVCYDLILNGSPDQKGVKLELL